MSKKDLKKFTDVRSPKAWYLVCRHRESLQSVELVAFGANSVEAFRHVSSRFSDVPLDLVDSMMITDEHTIINATYMTHKPLLIAAV